MARTPKPPKPIPKDSKNASDTGSQESRYIEVSVTVCERLRILSRLWNTNVSEVVAKLASDLTEEPTTFQGPRSQRLSSTTVPSVESGRVRGTTTTDALASEARLIKVFARHAGFWFCGLMNPGDHHITIVNSPLAGQSFRSPTGATYAVLSLGKPNASSSINGWKFWRLTSNGQFIDTLRQRATPGTSTTSTETSNQGNQE